MIELIRSCWSLYRGIVLDVDAEMPELHGLATYYCGALWVAEAQGRVVGMIAARSSADAPDVWEICRVYVEPGLHGQGLGHTLLDIAEAHALAAGARRFVLWSDTRFERAHSFYEKRSYVRAGGVRALHDLSNSLEFGYAKPVGGIERLEAAGAASAGYRLADLLVACVDSGASLGFFPPLDIDRARTFWRVAASDVAKRQLTVLGGWRNGILCGCVCINLATPENQAHRAEIQALLVHPAARRVGLGRDLMIGAEVAARAAGRTLLTLDTRVDDAAALLFAALGWQKAGCIPGYALDAGRTPRDTVFLWKSLGGRQQRAADPVDL